MSLKRVAACIKRNKSFLITAHLNLEGDALGAELAFSRLLKGLEKRAVIINEDSLPYGYAFLPGVNQIKRYKHNLKDIRCDCFVALDCSDLERCGEVRYLNKDKSVILNIDHHISNKNFGDINWVEPHSSSTCEMIYELFKEMGVALDRISALYLYVGILTDTGSFRYSNTTPFVHQIAAELLRFPLDVPKIYKNIYGNIPLQDMRLLARILPAMKFRAGGRIVWFAIPQEILRHKKISFDLTENILSFGRVIKGAEVVVLFKENLGVKDEIRVNFRSQGKVDVNKIAAFFGGGGHRAASACTMHGRLVVIRKKVLRKIEEILK